MKDTTFPILKTLAVGCLILTVSGVSTSLAVIAGFFVPALFSCQGYFFRMENLDNEREYIKRKLRNIYIPFVFWSLLFLIGHNLFVSIGFIGRAPSAVPGSYHPYTLSEFFRRTWGIGFGMTDYDDAFCQLYWVFRALLVSSLLFLGITKLAGLRMQGERPRQIVGTTAAICFTLLLWMTLCGLQIPVIPGGGYRELLATLFMALGFLYRDIEPSINRRWLVTITSVVVLGLFTYFFPNILSSTSNITSFLSYVIPACAGFLLLHNVARFINGMGGPVVRLLTYVGDRWFYILGFALLSFKISGMIILLCNGLPWIALRQVPSVGGEIIGYGWAALNWLMGMCLPILIVWGWSKLDEHYNLTLENCMRYLLKGIVAFCILAWRFLIHFLLHLWNSIRDFFVGFKDIYKASNPRDE